MKVFCNVVTDSCALILFCMGIRPVQGADSWRPWTCNSRIGLACPDMGTLDQLV